MKTVVVGGGGGGLVSAIYASLRGEDVSLYEGHSKLGGCASYFKRGDFIFDAGATTLSGVSEDRPLGKLFKAMGASPKLHLCDPGMVIHLSDGRVVTYYRNFERWMMELEFHFPRLEHRGFWEKVQAHSQLGWEVLGELKSFPPTYENLLKLVFKPKYYPLALSVLTSTELKLRSFGLDDPMYLELINGILMISAQAEAARVPFLVGAMSLAYPQETYYPEGGMKEFMMFFEREFEKRGMKIFKRAKLLKLTKSASLKLHFANDEIEADRVIMNTPVWVSDKLMGQKRERRDGSWGAFVIYFGMKSEIPDLYQQVHLKNADIPHYFVSLSKPHDLLRAPAGFQAVTISFHVDARAWCALSDVEYFAEKKRLEDFILGDFRKRFGSSELLNVTSGTPSTFVDYTGRSFGWVGDCRGSWA